ncbi:caspase family protein [Candidatus Pelagibacter ubique]|nr:caspase family protein [Candidatus Pelagibacter ubique]
MKRIIKFLCTVLLLTSIFSVPAKANAWLVLEGISLGTQGLLKIKDKITDLNQDRKDKKKKKESQKIIIEINDEVLKINPSYINTLSQEEKIRISKSYYKSANKNFKEKNIIRGCTELYQVLILDKTMLSDKKLLKKIKKKVDKYDCTKYDFTTKKSNTDLKVANTNIGKTLCVSKSFNADYRFSNTSCKNDEREIQKGSDEYYEAQAFIEISNSTLIASKKSKPVKKKILKKKSEVLLAKGKVKFCSNKYRVGNPAIPTIKIPSAWVGCKELSMNSYVDEKFEGYFSKKSSWGKTDKELYSLVREALISEFTRNNLDINKLYEYLPSTKYAYLESKQKTQIAKAEPSQTQKVAKKDFKIDKNYLKSLPSNRAYYNWDNNESFELFYKQLSNISKQPNLSMNSNVWVNEYYRAKEKDHWNNKYPKSGGPKAWAQSTDGAWAWRTAGSKLSAAKKALDACSDYMKNKTYGSLKCVVVKVNDKILTYEEQNYYSEKHYGLPTILATIIRENEKMQLAKAEPTIKPKKKVVKVVKATQKIDNGILFSKNDDLDFDNTKELWHAIIIHKTKINIYRSDINSKINTKDKAINNAKSKCWFDPKYTSGDWPSENCVIYYVSNNKNFKEKITLDNKTNNLVIKKKLIQEVDLIKNPSKILSKSITPEFLGLERETYAQLKKEKFKKESENIEKYITANIKGSDLKEFNLEKETLDLVRIKRQERRETLYAKTCTGIIFGHKKGTKDWFNCLNEEELKEISNETKIAKKEPTEKPKNKVKVAKVEEPKQEEFKPKKTNQDNEAPVIEIAEVITVNDSSYEIEGSVSDNSKNIFVQVDGRTIPVKKGKFKIKRFSPIDEQIEIVATDQWGNRSSPKMVSIIIDQKDTIVADTFENLDPSKIRSRSNKNRVALIIGIEKYDQTPDATFANLDAQYFYEYARKGFGISKSNIKLLVDEDANLIQSLGTLSKWLPGKIKDGKTELIIFFAGHGLASNDGKELYLLPQDSDPDLLARTALSRTELFKEIIALNPKSVTMFLDTCYSGVSRDERTLLASARPIRIKADEQDTPNNFTIFSASQLDQISSGFKEAKHGIFSYYLMKGLEGKADANKDKDITNGELIAYMDQNVAQKASELGRQQNPSLAGDPDKVLMSYR